MKALRILQFTFIGIPIIGINLYAFGAWEHYTRPLADLDPDAAHHAPPPVIGGLGKGLFDFVSDRQQRRAEGHLFDVTALSDKRVVRYQRDLTIADVLRPGERDPGAAMHELYMLARAPALAMDLCESILQDLATACAVADVEVRDRPEGTYRVEMAIAFLQEEPAGDLELLGTAGVKSEPVDLVVSIGERRIAGEDRLRARAAVFKGARETCTRVRERTGSCVIESIAYEELPPDADGRFRIRAKAWLARLDTGAAPEGDFAAATEIDLPVAEPDTHSASLSPPASEGGVIGGLFRRFTGGDAPTEPTAETAATEPPGDTEGGGLGGLLAGITGGGGDEPAPAKKVEPRILNGGNALSGGRGVGKFVSVRTD